MCFCAFFEAKMALDLDVIRKAHVINGAVHENAKEYYHTSPVAIAKPSLILPESVKYQFPVHFDLKDLMVIGALTQSTVLMTGGTDCGKTTLAKLVQNGLFGQEEVGWHRLDVDTDFGKDALTDTDFNVITAGKKMSDGLYTAQGFLALPGFIGDEINRTSPLLANKLLHLFDEKDISLPNGQRVRLGRVYDGNRTYQFQIAAINEGADYAGTFDMDAALRRRTTIEIPMNIHRPSLLDRENMRNADHHIQLRGNTDRFEDVITVFKALGNPSFETHPSANLFLSYLERFDFCKNSITRSKASLKKNAGSYRHICDKPMDPLNQGVVPGSPGFSCEYLRCFSNQLCPHISGLTEGVSKKLRSVAGGFAVIRATKFAEMAARGVGQDKELENVLRKYTRSDLRGKDLVRASIEKYAENLEIEIEDIQAASTFVAYSKLGIAPMWVDNFYQGNRAAAIGYVVAAAKEKMEEGLSRQEFTNLQGLVDKTADESVIQAAERYCARENPWLGAAIEGLRAVNSQRRIDHKKAVDVVSIDDIYGG